MKHGRTHFPDSNNITVTVMGIEKLIKGIHPKTIKVVQNQF